MSNNEPLRRIGRALAESMDQASYAGYVAGFMAARDQAAAIASGNGATLTARAIAALAPLPARDRKAPGRG
jgi:H+/gluconate symporter-like permease